STLVARMGGKISVASVPAQGSTFSFTIACPLSGANQPALSAASPHLSAAARVAPLRILVAEDNRVNQMLMQRLLQARGHAVQLAENGRSVLDALENGNFDLVLMDVQMPGMDGLEATRILRDRYRVGARMPIIAMTAHAMEGDREKCLAAGMDGY